MGDDDGPGRLPGDEAQAGDGPPADGEAPGDGEASSALPRRVEAWRRRSATGALLTGMAFGLREALEPERREPSIVQETSGLPPEDLAVEADLAEGHARRNTVSVRPWLLDGEGDGPGRPDRPTTTPTPARRPRGRRRGSR